MKMSYKKIVPFALGIAGLMPIVSSCDDVQLRGVIDAKGDNKLFVTDVENVSEQYVIDCKYLPAGRWLYGALTPGDTVIGKYDARANKLGVSVVPDTMTRLVLDCKNLNLDSVVYRPGERGAEDIIIQELIQARRANMRQK